MAEQQQQPEPDSGTAPVLGYLSSDRVRLADTVREPTPPLAKAIVVGGALAFYAAGIGGRSILPPITLGLFASLITAWWVVFRAGASAASPRTLLHLRLSTIALSVALIVFCGRVGDAMEGASGIRYWTEDNPGYRFARHHAMRVVPFVAAGALWFAVAAAVFAVDLRRRKNRGDPCVPSAGSQ